MNKKAPVHLWIVGVLSLLWNAMGCFDYLMTMTKNEAYLARFTPEQLEYFFSFPIWAESAWAIAVWSSLLGSVLLLVRRAWALPVFSISFVAMLATTVYSYALSDGLKHMGGVGPLIFSAVIFVIALALVFYSKAMAQRGVLR